MCLIGKSRYRNLDFENVQVLTVVLFHLILNPGLYKLPCNEFKSVSSLCTLEFRRKAVPPSPMIAFSCTLDSSH